MNDEIRSKIDDQSLLKIKTNEQQKMMSFQLLGSAIMTLDRTKKKVEDEVEKISKETETLIKASILKNNIDLSKYRFKSIDFKNSELIFEELPNKAEDK